MTRIRVSRQLPLNSRQPHTNIRTTVTFMTCTRTVPIRAAFRSLTRHKGRSRAQSVQPLVRLGELSDDRSVGAGLGVSSDSGVSLDDVEACGA